MASSSSLPQKDSVIEEVRLVPWLKSEHKTALQLQEGWME